MRVKHLLVAATAALALAGCDSRTNPMITAIGGQTGGSAGLSVTPTTVTLTEGESTRLTVSATRALGPYNWSTNAPGVATVTSDGLVSAIAPGTALITVTSGVDPSAAARATITVRSAASSPQG